MSTIAAYCSLVIAHHESHVADRREAVARARRAEQADRPGLARRLAAFLVGSRPSQASGRPA